MKVNRSSDAFTLLELLVVIAIVGVLLALLLPAIQRVRDAGLRMRCFNNLRQIGFAAHHYEALHHCFPPGVSFRNGRDPHPFMSWGTRLLPFLEQDQLWRQALESFSRNPIFYKPPHPGLSTILPVYACPSDARVLSTRSKRVKAAFTSYLGVEGTTQVLKDGVLYLDSQTRIADITDGTSNTLLVGERPPNTSGSLGWWYAGEGQSKDGSTDTVLSVRELKVSGYGRGCPRGPYQFGPGRIDNPCDVFHFWSPHAGGGASFLFCDGSVKFLSYSANPFLPALATRRNGESTMIPE